MSDRAITQCDHCEGLDDHPKAHYGLETYHHDCTPAHVRREILAGSDNPDRTKSIFEAADNGVRGSDLFNHILGVHENG